MATITVVEDKEKSESSPPPKNDTSDEKAVEMGMAAAFGEMKESNRQTQEKLAQLEAERQAERAEREAERANLAAAHRRIDELTAALEEEEEDLEEVEKVIPPKLEEKAKSDEKPKPKRSMIHKLWLG